MQCAKCGQEVPADAIYCPHCTGQQATTDREVMLGGVKGGTLGLGLGLLIVTAVLAFYDLERGIKAIVLIVPVATFTTGLIIGLVKAKRDWK